MDSKTWSSFEKSWQNGHEGLWAYDYVESFCNGCIWLHVNHFGCIWISFWLYMNQYFGCIWLDVNHFGCRWLNVNHFWLYMNLILVNHFGCIFELYFSPRICFGCQKNKTNSLLTSSEGNGFWERPMVFGPWCKQYKRHNKTQFHFISKT